MSATPEARAKANVRKAIKARPRCHMVHYPGGPRGVAGTPDYLGVDDGRAFALEVKPPGWRPPRPTNKRAHALWARQAAQLRLWREAGAVAAVVTSGVDAMRVLDAERSGVSSSPE